MKHAALAALLAATFVLAGSPRAAHADPSSSRDSVYLVGEFVDPVCLFQHGMTGVNQKQCALVRGHVNQGVYFFDHRGRHVYAVIGMEHTDDPYARFVELLGDTVAVTGKVWSRYGGNALAITNLWPWREQPAATFRWWPWTWHVSTVFGCCVFLVAYLLAMTVWRRRLGGPERFPWGRAAVFFAAFLVVLGSLNGPIHDLSDEFLFSAHMTQHLLLAEIFPLLFLLGIPPWLADRLLARERVRGAWYALADYRVGFVLYCAVIGLWHVPVFYDLMMRAHNVHIFMHLMLMAAATIMWWPFVGTASTARRLSPPAQMLYLLVLSTPMMLVAAFLTFATRPFYEWYALAPRLWGTTALDDQHMGGLIMWIPGTFVYWGILSVIFLRWGHRRDNVPRGDDFEIPPMPAPSPE